MSDDPKQQEEQGAEKPAEAEAADTEEPVEEAEAPEEEREEERRPAQPSYLDMLTQQLQEKDAQLREYIAAHKRAEDDFRRAKERFEREMGREVELEKAKLVTGLFDVLDNFERSLEASKGPKSFDALYEGVAMVHQQLLGKLGELGLRRFAPQGEDFNPESQEAVAVAPVSKDADHNKVVAVLRAGYAIGDRVLRPAMVQVGRKV
jgi:molecular chaperone GrpE